MVRIQPNWVNLETSIRHHPHRRWFEVAPLGGAKNNAAYFGNSCGLSVDTRHTSQLLSQTPENNLPLSTSRVLFFANSTPVAFIKFVFGSGFTGMFNSVLNAGTAEPFGIAPAKPVAYKELVNVFARSAKCPARLKSKSTNLWNNRVF